MSSYIFPCTYIHINFKSFLKTCHNRIQESRKYSSPGRAMGLEGWALSPWVHEESDTTEQFSVSLSLPYQNRDFGTLKYRLPSRWELSHVIWHLHCRRWDSDQTWGRYLYALIHGSSVAFFRGFGLLSQRKLINTCATFVGQLTSLEMFISHSDIKEV